MAARARAVAAGGRACSLSRRLPSHGSAGQTAPRNPVSVCGCRGSAGGGSGCAQQRHVRCRLKVRRHRRAGAIVAGSSVGRRYCGRPLRALPAHGRPLALPLLPAQPHRSHWERLHRDAPHLGQVRRRGRRQPVHSRSGKRVSPCGTTQPPPVQAQARAARSCCALDPSSRSPRQALALQFFLAWSPGRRLLLPGMCCWRHTQSAPSPRAGYWVRVRVGCSAPPSARSGAARRPARPQ